MILEAVKLSLKIALISTSISLILGFVIASMIYKGNRKRERIIESIISFPLFFPPSVLGYLLLLFIGRNGILGKSLYKYGIQLVFTWKAGVIACVIVSLPMVYQCIKAGLLGIERMYLEAAYEMGANKIEIYRYVILPFIKGNVGAAIVLAFGRSFGEFGATLMVAGNIPGKTQTIPMAIYYAVERGDTRTANIFLGIVVSVSFVVMCGYNHYWINNRKKKVDLYGR